MTANPEPIRPAAPDLGVYLHYHTAGPPSDESIDSAFRLRGTNYLYITATAAQAGARRALAPQGQKDPNGLPHLVFHDALRHLLRRPLLTRSEQRIILQRYADIIAVGDEPRRRQLRHDAEAWSEALADLDSQGIDLGQGVPDHVGSQLAHPALADLLVSLQTAVRNAEHEAGRMTFEHAVRAFLDTEFEPPAKVVLEGFTFLTELQRRFVESSASRAEVHFLIPYRQQQERAFAIIRHTYASWWGDGPTPIDSDAPSASTALTTLQDSIFGIPPVSKAPIDDTLSIAGFAHRHHEVAACIRQIRSLCESGRSPDEIAIVTRTPDQYRPLLREEAAVQSLGVRIGVPPRLLLLTPLGRFVLSLYELRLDGEFYLSAEQMRTILASGWLGARAQGSADRFSAVTAQTFGRCRTRAEWTDALSALGHVPTEIAQIERLPSRTIHAEDLALWASALAQIEQLSGRLFGVGATSIAGHVQLLLDSLESLSSENLFETEREIVVQIREALEESARATTLAINAAEFSEILVALARQYEEAAGTQTSDDARTQGDETPGSIWVTSPEGIDGMVRPIVIYLGVDESRVPRAFADSWPLLSATVEEHLDLERYLFVAVVRAAGEQLHISYSYADAGGHHEASGYIGAIGDVIELPAQSPSPSPKRLPQAAVAHATGVARRERYTLAEIAQYGLCPFRYKMERIDEVAGVYREEFQVNALAQAAWVCAALAEAERAGQILNGSAALREHLVQALDSTEESVRATFSGVRALAWGTIKGWAWRDIDLIVTWLEVGTYNVRIIAPREAGFELVDGDRVTYVDARPRFAALVGVIEKAITRDRQREEWLIWTQEDLDGDTFVDVDGRRLFDTRYRAILWWGDAVRHAYAYADPFRPRPAWVETQYPARADQVAMLVAQLEQGEFPRRPDDHCRYCPVQRECLGLDP